MGLFGKPGRKIEARPSIILHPNIPKPLHGVAPRTILGKDWWDEAKREAYAKASRQCMCCGDFVKHDPQYPRLEAHECYRIDYKRGTVTFLEVVAICHWCHMGVHSGLAQTMHRDGKIDSVEYARILRHKERIVAECRRLRCENPYVVKDGDYVQCAVPWADWKMVVFNEEYPARFKSYDEWATFYRLKNQTPDD